MALSYLPPLLTSAFLALARWLDRRSGARLPQLLLGILFAKGRRTVTSWFRAAGIADDFRPAYATGCAVGRRATPMAIGDTATPLLFEEAGYRSVAFASFPAADAAAIRRWIALSPLTLAQLRQPSSAVRRASLPARSHHR